MLPLAADAAYFKLPSVTKPTRNQYQITSKQLVKKSRSSSLSVTQKPYTSINNPFIFSYPSDWETYDLVKNRGVTISPKDDGVTLKSQRPSQVAFTVDTGAKKKEYSVTELDQYFMNKATLAGESKLIDWYIPSFKLISSDDDTLFEKPAKRYVYEAEIESKKFKVLTFFSVFDGKFYRVSFRAEPENYDADSAVFFQKIFPSLRLSDAVFSSSSSKISRTLLRVQKRTSSAKSHSSYSSVSSGSRYSSDS